MRPGAENFDGAQRQLAGVLEFGRSERRVSVLAKLQPGVAGKGKKVKKSLKKVLMKPVSQI